MAPYLYPRAYSRLYHPWWYYRSTTPYYSTYYPYYLYSGYLPLDRYDRHYIKYPYSYSYYSTTYTPSWDLDLKPRYYSDYIPPVYTPLSRSRSYSDFDEYLDRKSKFLGTRSPSYLSADKSSLIKRSSSVDNMLLCSRVYRPRLSDLYNEIDKYYSWYDRIGRYSPSLYRYSQWSRDWLSPYAY